MDGGKDMLKFVIAGAGIRGLRMFGESIAKPEYRDAATLCGVYDVNIVRSRLFSVKCGDVPVYMDFDEMLVKVTPDYVIVATVDCFHDEYIIKALKAGCDVISEKPLTMTAEKCNAILAAEKESGKKVIVTFNMRYMPYALRVKELIDEGIVGDILSVDMNWHLDTSHGADYFRRWHRYMDKSAGLLIHKATHHFDAINWWIKSYPKTVSAQGRLCFYGDTRKERSDRCLTCAHQQRCNFYWDITKDDFMKECYLDAELEDGYIRDACVFSQDIDIYDSMTVQVTYESGTLLSYSLNAYSPYEGFSCIINGTRGRLELRNIYSGSDAALPMDEIIFYNRRQERITYTMPKVSGEHGGSDARLIEKLILGGLPQYDKCAATSIDGAYSMMIGVAANMSIAEKRFVDIKDILSE